MRWMRGVVSAIVSRERIRGVGNIQFRMKEALTGFELVV